MNTKICTYKMARICYFKSEILRFHFKQDFIIKYKQFFGISCM